METKDHNVDQTDMSIPRFKAGGLQQKLFRSFLSLTAMGLVLLCTSLVAIIWLRTSTSRLIEQRVPAVEAAQLARIGVQRSLAGLRGWVTLGDPKFRVERESAWNEEIEPAMVKLTSLSQEEPTTQDRVRLDELDRLLAELKESQWWVEDIAQAEGNEKARVILSQKVEPISRQIIKSVRAIGGEDIRERNSPDSEIFSREMTGFKVARLSGDHMLSNFVVHREGWSEVGFLQNLDVAQKTLQRVESDTSILTKEQQVHLAALKREIPWYQHFAEEAIAARKDPQWNVARHLMRTETVPLSEQVMSQLNGLSTTQLGLMRQEADYVDWLGKGAILVSFGLIIGMAVVAGIMSRRRAKHITQPLARLAEATQELAAGQWHRDLPVTSDDELGSLTHSFNHMRVALKESEEALQKSYSQLASEHDRAEGLLLNILPSPIAERLKNEQGIIADSFPEVTVMFADMVGFTQLSSQIPPEKLVQSLNIVFSVFDTLAEQYGLEKIKTIGDAYMVVGGLPFPRQDHAEAIANMALQMLKEIEALNREGSTRFQIRIGINLGPVVAGVIGHKKFIYDIWGDTVNIASRMESHGIPGAIQVTEACYRRLQSKYSFEARGNIHIKGKGEMPTYLLTGLSSDSKGKPSGAQVSH